MDIKGAITRRRFLEQSLLTAAAALPAAAAVHAQARPTRTSTDRIRVGVIGVRGRGRAHIKAFKDSPDSEVVAICDPDDGIIEPAQNAVPNATYHRDIREMLERDDIHAVSIATPNHWHALAAVWALRAGKHVYVEKPISYDVGEGRELYETAQRTGLIVQHGTQARSNRATVEAIAWLRDGGLGRVRLARGLCYKRRESIGTVSGPQDPPETCDYGLWTGPAELRPLMRKELHYDWHWDYNTGNGDIGNQGVHQIDIARWGLGKTGFPSRIVSCGGRFGYDDDGNTANTQIALLDYGDAQVIFEVRGLETSGYRDTTIGVVFDCDEGFLVSASYAKVVAYDREGNEIKVFEGGGDHVQNFLDAVRSGRPGDLTATAWDGHVSSGMGHLANISYMLGMPRTLGSDDAPFGESDAANESFERMREHLASNGLDSRSTEFVSGPVLEFDRESERFVGDHATAPNRLLHREHRAGYRFGDFG